MIELRNAKVAPLDSTVVLNRFSCGSTPLDRFLKNRAMKASRRFEQRVFVLLGPDSKVCWGYYALQVGSDQVPDHPREKSTYLGKGYVAFPALNISYLGVHSNIQRRGFGTFLLLDALHKAAEVVERAGFYAVTLQSFDDASTAFYRSLGFEAYTGGAQPKMLYPVQTLLRLVGGAS